jgi:hypothetical protein
VFPWPSLPDRPADLTGRGNTKVSVDWEMKITQKEIELVLKDGHFEKVDMMM